MTFGKTLLCPKDPTKGNAVDSYRPISCLPLMWKLKTGIFAEKMYSQLERIYYHLNKKDATKGVMEQMTKCFLIKQC